MSCTILLQILHDKFIRECSFGPQAQIEFPRQSLSQSSLKLKIIILLTALDIVSMKTKLCLLLFLVHRLLCFVNVHSLYAIFLQKPNEEQKEKLIQSIVLQIELVEPAVNGTLIVLKACSVMSAKRAVIVSSVNAVTMNPNWPKHRVMDEDCWYDIEYCKRSEVFFFFFFLSI